MRKEFNTQEVLFALEQKGVFKNRKCPICGNNDFSLLEGFFNLTIESVINQNFTFTAPFVPSVAMYCTNCGFMNFHALGPLGLMPKEEEEEKN